MSRHITKDPHANPNEDGAAAIYFVGRDDHGNWVVREDRGLEGGLFATRETAMDFARDASEHRRADILLVSHVISPFGSS